MAEELFAAPDQLTEAPVTATLSEAVKRMIVVPGKFGPTFEGQSIVEGLAPHWAGVGGVVSGLGPGSGAGPGTGSGAGWGSCPEGGSGTGCGSGSWSAWRVTSGSRHPSTGNPAMSSESSVTSRAGSQTVLP